MNSRERIIAHREFCKMEELKRKEKIIINRHLTAVQIVKFGKVLYPLEERFNVNVYKV